MNQTVTSKDPGQLVRLDPPEEIGSLTWDEGKELRIRTETLNKAHEDVVQLREKLRYASVVAQALDNERRSFITRLSALGSHPGNDVYSVDEDSGKVFRVAKYMESAEKLQEDAPVSKSEVKA